MTDLNRRKLLKTSSTALGLSVIPGAVAAAKKKQNSDEGRLSINEKTDIVDNDRRAVHAIDITDEKKRDSRSRFLSVVEKESGSVTLSEVDAQQFNSITSTDKLTVSSENGGLSVSGGDSEIEFSTDEVMVAADDDIIVRSDVYAYDDGSCAAHNYTHVWAAATAEFTDEVGDLSWASIGAALISLVGSSSVTGGAAAALVAAITLIGGLAAIVTDTYTLTVGVKEWDQGIGGHEQTMYSSRVAPGYHRGRGELTTTQFSPGHPGRI